MRASGNPPVLNSSAETTLVVKIVMVAALGRHRRVVRDRRADVEGLVRLAVPTVGAPRAVLERPHDRVMRHGSRRARRASRVTARDGKSDRCENRKQCDEHDGDDALVRAPCCTETACHRSPSARAVASGRSLVEDAPPGRPCLWPATRSSRDAGHAPSSLVEGSRGVSSTACSRPSAGSRRPRSLPRFVVRFGLCRAGGGRPWFRCPVLDVPAALPLTSA